MIILTGTGDKLRVVTGQAVTVDSSVFWADYNAGTVTPGKTLAAISTATTTDVSGSPASSTQRKIKAGFWRNKHASNPVDITVHFFDGSTAYELHKVTLNAGQCLQYVEGVGFFTLQAPAAPAPTFISSSQSIGASTTAYVTNSGFLVPTLRPLVVGTILTWYLVYSKTAAATAALSFLMKRGTTGGTGDTTDLTATTGTQTAAADVGIVRATAMVRALGGSGSVHYVLHHLHNLAATGLDSKGDMIVEATVTVDTTVAALIFGIAITTGASHALTILQVSAKAENI